MKSMRGVPNKKAYFEVRDNGKDFDKNEIPYLFGRFFTKGEAGPDSRRGIRLGLSIAKSIVTAHGGEIIAFSRYPMALFSGLFCRCSLQRRRITHESNQSTGD